VGIRSARIDESGELRRTLHATGRRDDKTDVRILRVAGFLVGWMAALQVVFAAFPRPDGYVTDLADVLTEDDEAYLEHYLGTLEAETSAELAVVTVNSLDGMTIEEYAHRLFADWGIGKKREDNGVLLLVAPNEKAVRIEVGYGVEAILPDGLAGEIIRTAILPEFRADNLRRGIGRGVDGIARVVRRDPGAVSAPPPGSEPKGDRPAAVAAVPFFALFVTLAGLVAGLGLATRTVGPLVWSGLFGGIALVVATEFVSVPWIAGLLSLGLCSLIVGRRSGRSRYWLGVLRKGTPGSVVESESLPWTMGGSPGSTASDGSSDSHGTSTSSDFGGGSSGGGGASGRW
jgi:uncharacterized protein